MSTVASDLATGTLPLEVESAECPICLRPMKKPHKCKTLYGMKVCRKCRNGFANRRQAAYLVDIIIYLVLSYAILGGGAALLFLVSAKTQPNSSQVTPQDEFVTILIAVLSYLVLPLLFTLKDAVSGRSLGRLLLGVQVVDAVNREPIGARQSFKRNLILMIPYVGFIGIVLTMMKGQRWCDKWANTMVIWRKYATRVPFSPAGRYCRQCGYDLTGNISGRCPECGLEVARPERPKAYCLQCGYDLTGNVSGWCPECGREITNVPLPLEPPAEFQQAVQAGEPS